MRSECRSPSCCVSTRCRCLPMVCCASTAQCGREPRRCALTVPLLWNSLDVSPEPRHPGGTAWGSQPSQLGWPGSPHQQDPGSLPTQQCCLWAAVLSIYRPCQGLCSVGFCGPGCLKPPPGWWRKWCQELSKLRWVWARVSFYVQTNKIFGREITSGLARQLKVPIEDGGIYICSGAKCFRDKYY